MAISNGSTILAADLLSVYTTGLSNLRSANFAKQHQVIISFNGVTNTTAEYLRTFTFTPTTDCVLRSFRIYCNSTTASIKGTVTIPAQIIENNTVVGGNITTSLTATATSNTGAILSDSGNKVTLPNTDRFTFLAGDSIEIIVSTDNAAAANLTVTMQLENVLKQ